MPQFRAEELSKHDVCPNQQLELMCQLPVGASCYGRYDLTQDRVIIISHYLYGYIRDVELSA